MTDDERLAQIRDRHRQDVTSRWHSDIAFLLDRLDAAESEAEQARTVAAQQLDANVTLRRELDAANAEVELLRKGNERLKTWARAEHIERDRVTEGLQRLAQYLMNADLEESLEVLAALEAGRMPELPALRGGNP